METIQKGLSFKLKKSLTPDQLQKVKIKLESQLGVINLVDQNNLLKVTYEPYKVSDKYLTSLIKQIDFISLSNKKKGLVSRWIEKLAKSNKKNIGNQKLDCC